MALAGRIADGVIFGNGLSDEVVRDNLGRVREAAESAGRRPEDLEPWFMVKLVLAQSEEQAWRDHAWTLAASANHSFRSSFEGKHVPPEYHDGIRKLQAGYDSYRHNSEEAGS